MGHASNWFGALARYKIFSSLDAAQAFHNITIEEASQDATAFICMCGLFMIMLMFYGLCIAGAVYCQVVAQIMANLGLELVVHFLDHQIIIISRLSMERVFI